MYITEDTHQSLAVFGYAAAVEEAQSPQQKGKTFILDNTIPMRIEISIEGVTFGALAPLTMNEGAGI